MVAIKTACAGLAAVLIVLDITSTLPGQQIVHGDFYDAKIVGGDAYNYILHATREPPGSVRALPAPC